MRGVQYIKQLFLGLGVTMAFGTLNQACAQQDPLYTMYMWNTLSVNPGYAGSADRLSLTALSRLQWAGIEGAPRTQSLVISTPLKNQHLGIGLSVNHDKAGPITNTGLYGDFAYRMHLTSETRLALGLKAGVNMLQGNFRDLANTDPTDPNFQQNISNKISPNFGFGAYLYNPKGYIGLAAPKLFEGGQQLARGDDPGVVGFFKEQRHYFLVAGYVFDIDKGIKYRPSILIKAVQGAPIALDLTNMFLFAEKFWAGLSYRHNESIDAIVSYQFSNQLRAGYAYDFAISGLQGYQGGSHEVMVTYDLKFIKHMVLSPRYF